MGPSGEAAVSQPDWLPALVLFKDSGFQWQPYEDKVYGYFRADFLDSTPHALGMPVVVRRHPSFKGKEWAFWHLTSSAKIEEERRPDLRRCERIRWPRPIVGSCGEDRVRAWEKGPAKDRRLLVALPDFSYLVVLASKKDHLVLITAYCIEHRHEQRRLEREWRRNKP
jgi:hypothetical protein